MKAICQGRGTGKTTMLIKLSAKNRIPILVHDGHLKSDIMEKAKELGVEIPKPLAFNEEKTSIKDRGICKKVYVDNAELLLKEILNSQGIAPEVITLSNDDCDYFMNW